MPDTPPTSPAPIGDEAALLAVCQWRDGVIAEDVPCEKCRYNLRTLTADAACPECGHAVRATLLAREVRPVDTLTLEYFPIWTRVFYGIFGFGPPLFCFAMATGDNPPFPEWRSDNLEAYAGVMLGLMATLPFYPLVAWSMLSIAAVLFRPAWAARQRWCRWGVFTGIALGMQYVVLLWSALGGVVGAIAAVVALLLTAGFLKLRLVITQRDSWRMSAERRKLIWVFSLVALIASVVTPLIGVLLIGSPLWTLLVFALTWLRIRRTNAALHPLRWPLLWGTLYGSTWAVSWSLAIANAMKAYAQLPIMPPSCYIATAAARGHPRFVGSEPLTLPDGRVIRVNQQLRTLKAGEIALRAVAPRLHRACRRVYGAVGPRLAGCLVFPLLADVTYAALVPAAWFTRRLLRLALPGADALIARLYRP